MKQYKVRIWIAYSPSDVFIWGMNSANALSIAKKIYPNARVISAKPA